MCGSLHNAAACRCTQQSTSPEQYRGLKCVATYFYLSRAGTMASTQRLHVSAATAGRLGPKKLAIRTAQRPVVKIQPCRALEVDWTDPDTWVGILAAVGGLGAGVGFLVFSEQRIDEDEKSLEELRKLNRDTFKETGQYLSKACSCSETVGIA
jgi:hypothetical protein